MTSCVVNRMCIIKLTQEYEFIGSNLMITLMSVYVILAKQGKKVRGLDVAESWNYSTIRGSVYLPIINA